MMSSGVAYRIVLIALAVLFSFLCAGVVFGFQPLLHVLKASGVFHRVCNDDPDSADGGAVIICAEQKRLLEELFLVASCLTNASAIIIGYILDNYGPRVTILIGSVLFFCGNAGFSLAANGAHEWLYLPAYGLLGVGGPFIFMSTLHLSEAFPSHSGLIISLLTGAFDSSSIIYEFFSMIYRGTSGRIGIPEFFTAYCAIPVFSFVYGMLMMPREPFSAPLSSPAGDEECCGGQERAESEISNSEDDNDSIDTIVSPVKANDASNNSGGCSPLNATPLPVTMDETTPLLPQSASKQITYRLKDKRISEQISSLQYLLMVLFMCLHMLRLNFYMQTMSYQVGALFGANSRTAADLSSWFGLLLPVGGVVAIPPMAWLFDRFPPRVPFNLISAMTLLFGLLSMFPIEFLNYIAVVMFVIMRPILYTAASDYCAKAYGFRTFGQVYGLMVLMSAMFGFSAYLLSYLVENVFAGSYLVINIALTILCATFGWLFPAWLLINE